MKPSSSMKSLKARGLPLAAVFDLDKTVWDGHGIDYFLSALVESGLVKRLPRMPWLKRCRRFRGWIRPP